MAETISTEPLDKNVTSLQGLYTDFDDWVIKYYKSYKRSIHSPETTQQTQDNNSKQQNNTDNIILEDIFAVEIFLKQRRPAKQSSVNLLKENDGFMFYDYILYRLMDKYDDRNIICRLVRSKL